MSLLTERDQLVDELRRSDKLLLTTHENPDGDALGSLLGMHLVLEQLGKDSVMFLAANQFPLPYEYQRMPLAEVSHELPDDVNERTILFLDCGNIDRTPVHFLQNSHLHVLNIDHHHDNTRFGTVNLVVPEASCAAEIVYDLAKELGVEITPELAEALYIGLVTDTGKFMFENTTPESHQMAAELIEAGVAASGRAPQALRGAALRAPAAARPGAELRAPLRRRRDHAHPHHARALRRDRARASRTPRGSSTTCARSRAP